LQNYKNYKDQIRSLWNQETRSFLRLFTVSLLCNGSAIKGRGVSSVGSQHGRFFIEGVSYGAFRRPAVTTAEAAAGSIKAEQRRPREGRGREKKPRKTEEETQKTERKKIHRAKKQRQTQT
jgi:hypothetical protein